MPHELPRKAENARGAADMLESPGNLLLLLAQPFGSEDGVCRALSLAAQRVHELRQLVVTGGTRLTVREMLGNGRVEPRALALGHVPFEQPLVVKVGAMDHSFPPSSPRSLRAARNKCTRTVDSFRPVIMLT